MDPEQANQFIKSLTKNIHVLCCSLFSFNSSMQVIGHLYVNLDSDVCMDYIVNEKVSKNDTYSLTTVSKSYHSEPIYNQLKLWNSKPKEKLQKSNGTQTSVPEQNDNLNSETVKVQRRRVKQSVHVRNFEDSGPPQKMPRMSVSDGEEERLFKSDVKTKIVTHGNQTVNVIDLSDVKDEPDEELDEKLCNTSEGDKEEIGMSHEVGTSTDSFSENIPTDTATAASMTLSKKFPPFQFPKNSSSSLPHGGNKILPKPVDSNVRKPQKGKDHLDIIKSPFFCKSMNRKTKDTIVDIILGRCEAPSQDPALLQNSAWGTYYKAGKDSWTVMPTDDGYKLYFRDKEVEVYDDPIYSSSDTQKRGVV